MDERASIRVEVDKLVDYKIGDRRAQALLYNLSVGGCMIECADDSLGLGDEIALQLDYKIKSTGHILWQYGRHCGVKFEKNIHPSIVDHLGFKPGDVSEEFDRPVDRFGRFLAPLNG
jgi:hypothetical protein